MNIWKPREELFQGNSVVSDNSVCFQGHEERSCKFFLGLYSVRVSYPSHLTAFMFRHCSIEFLHLRREVEFNMVTHAFSSTVLGMEMFGRLSLQSSMI